MVINTWYTDYSSGGRVNNTLDTYYSTQDTNYYNGGLVFRTQDAYYSTGGIVINT